MFTDKLSEDTLTQHIKTFSDEQRRLMEELQKAASIKEEKPARNQLSVVSVIVNSLLRLRTIKRLEKEKEV
jgi:polyhydroxyalkanoate synthesis regulator protein